MKWNEVNKKERNILYCIYNLIKKKKKKKKKERE
jgi:hypothetical protein